MQQDLTCRVRAVPCSLEHGSEGQLPWELHSSIWELALSDIPPREIQIRSVSRDEQSQSREELEPYQVTIPVLLLSCRESHSIALQRYTHAFTHEGSRYTIWIDFRKDIICAEELSAPILLQHPDMQKVTISDQTSSG